MKRLGGGKGVEKYKGGRGFKKEGKCGIFCRNYGGRIAIPNPLDISDYIENEIDRMKHYEVVAGIIKHEGRILCVQRGKGKYDYISYKYEFPGGKVESGETREGALVREIKEELEIDIHNLKELTVVEHAYPDFSLTMYCFMAEAHSPELKLKEHVDSRWLSIGELPQLDWAAADIPAVKKLTELL